MERPLSLASVVINVSSPEQLAKFYVTNFGMRLRRGNAEIQVGYGGQSAWITLRQAVSDTKYQHSLHDLYWKVGITLPDLDLAYAQLRQRGLDISEPRQFRDVGYMCHLSDPEGFQIELLQHTFKGEKKTSVGDPKMPLGGGAIIGQITLRTDCITPQLSHFVDELGMKFLSRQPLEEYGFDLYFLAFTDEQPPEPKLSSVGNRPWLWQRPYTTLEFQHRLNAESKVLNPIEMEPGFAGLIVLE